MRLGHAGVRHVRRMPSAALDGVGRRKRHLLHGSQPATDTRMAAPHSGPKGPTVASPATKPVASPASSTTAADADPSAATAASGAASASAALALAPSTCSATGFAAVSTDEA